LSYYQCEPAQPGSQDLSAYPKPDLLIRDLVRSTVEPFNYVKCRKADDISEASQINTMKILEYPRNDEP
jgi:hypothetical protein